MDSLRASLGECKTRLDVITEEHSEVLQQLKKTQELCNDDVAALTQENHGLQVTSTVPRLDESVSVVEGGRRTQNVCCFQHSSENEKRV